MSRQAQLDTEITVKDPDMLKEAVEIAAKEVNGQVVDNIPYYNGKVLGIKVGRFHIGAVVGKNGKLTLVGEDIDLHSEMGRKIKGIIEKSYGSVAVAKALTAAGFRFTVTRAFVNTFKGVRA